MTIQNDLPTLNDKLGWKDELDRLADRIQGCPTPHVLGIHGDWGSGKTSFMRQLQGRLGGEMPEDGSISANGRFHNKRKQEQLQKKIITIWFDAWRYQNEPVPVVALLQEMRRQMALLAAVKKKFEKLGEITLRYTLDSFSDLGKAIGFEGIPSAEKIEKLGENWEQMHHAQPLHTDSIRKHLHETIKCLLPSDDARVVVFIDDLDRCNPKAAIRLLEGLKVYLSIPNCVFILGMNERILVDAIREEISAPKETPPEELKLRAGHYLEKICTDIFRLPLPSNPTVLLSGWIEAEAHREALTWAIGNRACLPPNPRRLKALANQWGRFSRCTPFPANEADQRFWAVRVLIAAYIHQFHRDLWERWHFNPEFWNEIKAWSGGEREEIPDPFHKDDKRGGPEWVGSLRLTDKVDHWDDQSKAVWKSSYPNPGDIENFWIGSLIREYRDQLAPLDFEPLLKPKGLGVPP